MYLSKLEGYCSSLTQCGLNSVCYLTYLDWLTLNLQILFTLKETDETLSFDNTSLFVLSMILNDLRLFVENRRTNATFLIEFKLTRPGLFEMNDSRYYFII